MAERENGRRNAGRRQEENFRRNQLEAGQFEKRQEQERNRNENRKTSRQKSRDADIIAERKAQKEKKRQEEQLKRMEERRKKHQKRMENRANRPSKNTGLILFVLQLMASGLFMSLLVWLNIVPTLQLLAVGGILVLLALLTLFSQLKASKKGLAGKIFSVIVSIILLVGSFWVYKTYDIVGKITNANYKLDRMVVAVLKDDGANDLKDAKDYTFGVQYQMDGMKVQKAVDKINKEIGKEVATQTYDNISEQAKALHDGKVKAIIYNEGYTELLEESFSAYKDSIKVIYEYEIKTEMENLSLDVSVEKEPFTVYISGIDTYGDVSETSRSDVNIIATVNPQSHQILLVTTPRDYYIPIPGISRGQEDKLTHAGLYGVDRSMATLSELYGVDIPFYARINFTSMIEIIDTLGGVDVVSEYEFETGTDAGAVVSVKKGTNHFNGKEALAFCRERHNLADGDNQRGKNQQAVLTGMIKKLVTPNMLIKAGSIMDSVAKSVDTNMSTDQLTRLIRNQLKTNAKWYITSVAAEGTQYRTSDCYSMPGESVYVCLPDENSVDSIKEMINKVEKGQVLEEYTTTSE